MSHNVTQKCRMTRPGMIARACKALAIPCTVGRTTVRLYEKSVEGDVVCQLPGWKYPVVIDTAGGTVTYDDYAGAWGDIDQLNALGQEYKLQTTCEWAENEGYFVERQKQANGHVNLLITGYK